MDEDRVLPRRDNHRRARPRSQRPAQLLGHHPDDQPRHCNGTGQNGGRSRPWDRVKSWPRASGFTTAIHWRPRLCFTYRQVDPALRSTCPNPASPRKSRRAEDPGFSTYIHPLDANNLLTIGIWHAGNRLDRAFAPAQHFDAGLRQSEAEVDPACGFVLRLVGSDA